MQDDNLLLNKENIFKLPNTNDMLSDINTGSVYRQAYNTYIKNPNREILCPIIFFIDKMHTDVKGRLCLEQIRFTLRIFKEELWHRPEFWRTLGYILDQKHILVDNASDKMKDYQAMVDLILTSLKKAQHEAIGWDLSYNNKVYCIYFRCPVMFIIGDTDGHDKLVGCFQCHTQLVKRLHQYCDCPTDKTNDPWYACNYVKHRTITKLIGKNDHEKLWSMSMHCIQNAW